MKLTVDTSGAIARLDRIEAALSKRGMGSLADFGQRLLRRDTMAAFSRGVDPTTGQAWEPRRYQKPWPLLIMSGTLRDNADAKSKVFTGMAIAQVAIPDKYVHVRGRRTPLLAYAQSHYSGRGTYRRTSSGRSRTRRSRGGYMPARKYAGMTPSSVSSFKRAVENHIAKTER